MASLASQPPREKVERYLALYHGGAVEFPFRFQNMMWQKALERSFAQVLELFKQARGRSEDSIVRNFAVKLLYWMDTYFPRLFVETAIRKFEKALNTYDQGIIEEAKTEFKKFLEMMEE